MEVGREKARVNGKSDGAVDEKEARSRKGLRKSIRWANKGVEMWIKGELLLSLFRGQGCWCIDCPGYILSEQEFVSTIYTAGPLLNQTSQAVVRQQQMQLVI